MNQLISDVIYYVETYDKMCWEATGECNAWN